MPLGASVSMATVDRKVEATTAGKRNVIKDQISQERRCDTTVSASRMVGGARS